MRLRMIVKGLIYVGGGPLVFGLMWLWSPPESVTAGVVRAAGILLGQIGGGISAATVKARFAPTNRAEGIVLAIALHSMFTIFCVYASILVAGFFGWVDFERGVLFSLEIGTALSSGLMVGFVKHWKAKTYTFLSTISIIAVLVFGTLRGIDEIVVLSATHSDKSFYVLSVPILLLALVELTRREFNRPS